MLHPGDTFALPDPDGNTHPDGWPGGRWGDGGTYRSEHLSGAHLMRIHEIRKDTVRCTVVDTDPPVLALNDPPMLPLVYTVPRCLVEECEKCTCPFSHAEWADHAEIGTGVRHSDCQD